MYTTRNLVLDHDGFVVARNMPARQMQLALGSGATVLRPNVIQLPVPRLVPLTGAAKRRIHLARAA